MYNGVTINNETAIKPYFYVRGELLQVRYNVDRAFKLTANEAQIVKDTLAATDKVIKQNVLEDFWYLFEHNVQKPIILDGIKYVEDNYIKGDHNAK